MVVQDDKSITSTGDLINNTIAYDTKSNYLLYDTTSELKDRIDILEQEVEKLKQYKSKTKYKLIMGED